MKITGFETFLVNAGLRNYLFIRISTDTGLTGVGEATLEWQEKTVQMLCHEWVEGRVLGRDPFDVERVVRVREAVGQGIGLMIEFHGRLSAPCATRVMRELEPFAPEWCEEPVSPEQVEQLAEVKQQTGMITAAGERLMTEADFSRMI